MGRGACVDLTSDPNNCGTVGMMCPDRCQASACIPDCTMMGGNFRDCNDACVNIRTDPLHCGACDRRCSTSQVCIEGNCRDYRVGVTCTTCPCMVACTGDFSNCCTYPMTPASVICIDGGGMCP